MKKSEFMSPRWDKHNSDEINGIKSLYGFNNVDPEDGVLSNRPVYSDNTKLTYDKIDRPFTSPMNATKGGGTTKVCLPQSKVNNMSPEQKEKSVRIYRKQR